MTKNKEITETIKGDALQLYIPSKDDGWFYVKMMSDPETMAYNAPWFPPDGCIPNPEEEWENLMSSWIGCEDKRFYAFLQRASDGCFVGDVNYHYNPEQEWYDMGIVIYAPERGKDYGKQGLNLLLDRAFRVNGISKLRNDFETTRGAAYYVHKSVGFKELGTKDGMFLLEMKREDYLRRVYLDDPCKTSSLPFWKTVQIKLPENIAVIRDDEFKVESCEVIDEPYFKLIHHVNEVQDYTLPDEFIMTDISVEEIANHINECYEEEGVTVDELALYKARDVYDENLWIAIREKDTNKIVASGIGEFDAAIGEGILDWIQVSAEYRQQGLGRAIVCELIKRLSQKADFITVSGRVNNTDNPFDLYQSCGFANPVIWHVITRHRCNYSIGNVQDGHPDIW